MDVKPVSLGGCVGLVLGVMTLGVGNVAIWMVRNSWPRRMDDAGLTTRRGTRFTWDEFTKVVKVTTVGAGGPMATRYDLVSRRGTVPIVPNQLHDGEEVLAYAWRRLPAAARSAG